tara:strand:+ start:304 stop:1338 length:1035 start_codon:yes stop_codon:yes gene_type:complete
MGNFLNKLSKTLLITFVGFFSMNPSYAFDLFYIEGVLDSTNSRTIKNQVYGIDLSKNSKTLLTEIELDSPDGSAGMNSFVSPSTGELIITDDNGHKAYSWEEDSWRIIDEELVGGVPLILQKPTTYGERSSNILSIGKNSLKLQETSNQMKLWATDSSGRIAPINITNGSKLLINGRDVEQSINNVGAMSAALTGLPTVPNNTTFTCGLGTGTHGGDFAFSGGCASKVNEKLSVNYAASMSMPGQEYAGDFEDQFSARAGFVWQLGESNKPTQISMNQKKEIDLKISKLENDNEFLKADNKELKTKNNEIISQNEKLLARLEKLENNALKFQSSSEMISVTTKD